MLIIFGTYIQKLEERESEKIAYVKLRKWFSIFFIPLIPHSHEHIFVDIQTRKKHEVNIPILPIALLLNPFFFLGIPITFGLLAWLLCLGVWIGIIYFGANQPALTEYFRIANIILLVVAEVLTYVGWKKRKQKLEAYKHDFSLET